MSVGGYRRGTPRRLPSATTPTHPLLPVRDGGCEEGFRVRGRVRVREGRGVDDDVALLDGLAVRLRLRGVADDRHDLRGLQGLALRGAPHEAEDLVSRATQRTRHREPDVPGRPAHEDRLRRCDDEGWMGSRGRRPRHRQSRARATPRTRRRPCSCAQHVTHTHSRLPPGAPRTYHPRSRLRSPPSRKIPSVGEVVGDETLRPRFRALPPAPRAACALAFFLSRRRLRRPAPHCSTCRGRASPSTGRTSSMTNHPSSSRRPRPA